MTDVALTLEPDELAGLRALVELRVPADDDHSGPAAADTDAVVRDTDVLGKARDLLRTALADQLEAAGLPWNPVADAVQDLAAKAAQPPTAMRRLLKNQQFRRYGLSGVAVAALVALWGGYVQGWPWTGFRSNEQLWDWLHLLLLPVVLGTIPLWIQHPDYISRARRTAYVAAILAWTGFVVAGYLVPLNWTGFPGNTLWDWFELILLPVAVLSIRAWPSLGRTVGLYRNASFAALATACVVTLVGGYSLGWNWTGYPGNTLWDWLQLLLVPLVFPTILLPALLKFVSGDAAGRAEAARAAAIAHREPSATAPTRR